MIIIMWACICIVLHNLIIQIEGDNFDSVWREGLVWRGLDLEHGGGGGSGADSDEEDDPADDLQWAWRRLETPGQRFQHSLMNDLFNSPLCDVEHCPE